MKRLFKLVVLATTCCLLFAGCDDTPVTSNVPSQPATQQPSDTPTATTQPTEDAAPTATPKPSAPVYDETLTYKFDVEEMTMPFWQSNTMYNECVVFHKNMQTGEISANTLFKPIQIIAFKDNSLTIDLIEGVHYKRDETDPYKLIWLEGNNDFVIPYFTDADLTEGHKDNCGTSSSGGKIGNCTYCVGPFLYEKQLAITYTFDPDECNAPHAEYSEDLLPKTVDKLKNSESLTIVIYGSSVYTGCDSSAIYNREPRTPTFFKLLEKQLEAYYPNCNIKIKNSSVGGWGVKDGVANVHNSVTVKKPDLVVLGFGGNDAQMEGKEVAAQTRLMIDDISAENPDCEFIVIACQKTNPQVGWDVKKKTHFAGLKTLEKTGIACVDMYSLHGYLMEHKTYQATTGNNINHPNDWFARMWASQILSMLYNYNK